MKRYFPVLVACFFTLFGFSPLFSQESFFDWADAFFQRYVIEGSVDYASLKAHPGELDTLVGHIAQYDLKGQSDERVKSFWINTYNLLVIRQVMDHYPIKSPQQISGFFNAYRHQVAGESLTLDELEKQRLFRHFPDFRVHFALNCAAVSCPPLASHAYFPERLAQQLTDQARRVLQLAEVVEMDTVAQVIRLNAIFDWYRADFSDVRQFLEEYGGWKGLESFDIQYLPYDWSLNGLKASTSQQEDTRSLSNVQRFTPSVLLQQGQVEVKVFNNFYTQTAYRDENREKISLNQRQSYYTGLFQFTYGLDPEGRWNIGLEMDVHAVRYDADPGSSFLDVLSRRTEGLEFRKATVSYLGPRIRFAPFRRLPKFSVTSTWLFPLRDDLELLDDAGTQRFLAHNRVSWWTQFFYDISFGRFQLFTEADLLFRFPTEKVSFTQDAFFRTPVTVFFSYFPSPRTTVNVNLQHSPAFSGLPGNAQGESFNLNRSFTQGGVGAKYQLTPAINLEVIYTHFFASRGEGAGQTFNLGLVWLK